MMNFINTYFIEPMGHYYTLPGTIVYAVLFVIAVFLIYKYFLKKLKINEKFMLALLPFIILGGVMRALEDAEFYSGYLFVSPGIYITVFFIALFSLLFSIQLEKYRKIKYWKTMLVIGSILLLYNIIQVMIIGIANWTAFFMIAALMLMWSAVFFPIQYFFPKYLSKTNYLILLSHLFDASSSFVAITFFSYVEQHVLPGFLFPIFGAWVLMLLKIIVVWPALYYIDKIEDKKLRIWLKIAVLILGLALGTRDFLSVSMMV
jgi:uncharacterized membrane protein